MDRLRYLILLSICWLFEKSTRILVKPFSGKAENRTLLRWFLEWDRTQRQHWIATFSFPLFGGTHPKNIFATRIGDLYAELLAFRDQDLRVMDFGCGSGKTLEFFAPSLSAGLGIDIAPPKDDAHRTIEKKFPQIEFEYRYLGPEALRERVRTFKPDLVVLSHVLEHIETPREYLSAFFPTPLLICLPSEEAWIQILRKNLDLSTKSDPTHFREYDSKLILEEFASAGYRPNRIRFNAEGEFVFIALPIEKRT